MTKFFVALGAVAVALSAAPADARHMRHHTHCAKYRHHRCVAWHHHMRMHRMAMRDAQARRAAYRVGYRFAPDYSYTEYSALPQPVVTRYHLRDNYRYVNDNGYVYVVNPTTYRVTRVISVP